MPYVKLDVNILHSTLWIERDQREVFITSLLMAAPREFTEPMRQIKIDSTRFVEPAFIVPPGWYGFVQAAGPGIANAAGLTRKEGLQALRKLGEPDQESRSKDYEGRRMIRVDGGFLILNFMKYRDKDHTGYLRQRKLRERRKEEINLRRDAEAAHGDNRYEPSPVTESRRDVTESRRDAEKTVEKIIDMPNLDDGPKKNKKTQKIHQSGKAVNPDAGAEMMAATWLFEELGQPADFGTREVAAQAIRLLAKEEGTVETAVSFLREVALQAKSNGETINRFWFLDQKYQPAKEGAKENGKAKPGVTKQRLDDSRRALAEAALKRGWIKPDDLVGKDAAQVSEPGARGHDSGVSSGLRESSGEILPPESGGSTGRATGRS